MCKVMEEMRKKSWEEGKRQDMKEVTLRMLNAGKYALEEIAEISGLSLDEVRKLHTEQTA